MEADRARQVAKVWARARSQVDLRHVRHVRSWLPMRLGDWQREEIIFDVEWRFADASVRTYRVTCEGLLVEQGTVEH